MRLKVQQVRIARSGVKKKKMALTLTTEDYDRLVTFAKVTGKPPAVAARDVLIEYLNNHAQDIEEAQKAAENYHAALSRIDSSYVQTSLFKD